MPREQINTPKSRIIEIIDDGKPGTSYSMRWAVDGEGLANEREHWENSPYLDIRWSSNADAQVGFEPDMQLTMVVNADEVIRAAEEIKRCRELQAKGELVGPFTDWPFSTVVLARAEAQKLIATTRRARNAVFGGDE